MDTATQLRLDLRSCADHYDLVAAMQRDDLVAWTPGRPGRAWHTLGKDRARDQLTRWTCEPDVFLTPNEFDRWRLIKRGRRLNAFFVDIDAHEEMAPDLERMTARAVGSIASMGWPEPNFIVKTGRGIHIYWLFHQVPFAALPRWQACQQVLVKALGGDRMSADATRVLRVIGSVNSKTNSMVSGELLTPERYDFEHLCIRFLPVERVVLHDMNAERARKGGVHRVVGTIYDRWYLVYQDLGKICDYHWQDGVAIGKRDTLLHLMATALSWFTLGDALSNEIRQTARRFMPSLSNSEVANFTTTVVARAKHDAASTCGWEWGRSRYFYRRLTLYWQLEDLIRPFPDLAEQLRAIASDEVIRSRKTDRERARKHAKGLSKKTREAYEASTRDRREAARSLRAKGLVIRQIADRLGVSATTIARDLKT